MWAQSVNVQPIVRKQQKKMGKNTNYARRHVGEKWGLYAVNTKRMETIFSNPIFSPPFKKWLSEQAISLPRVPT